MEHLASVAEMVANTERLCSSSPLPSPPTPVSKHKKRHSDGDMYLADEQLDFKKVMANHECYVFPRDDQFNYICVFQGCAKPILRGLDMQEYFKHLHIHASNSDILLSNMLRRAKPVVPDIERATQEEPMHTETKKRGRPRENSIDNNVPAVPTKKKKESSPMTSGEEVAWVIDREEKRSPSVSPSGSPLSPSSGSPSPRKRANSADVAIKPSSRGVQLRDQMLRYGLHLFRLDSEGKYICFFDECSLHMMTNFSRHIAKHEKNGDKIKAELLHHCALPNVQAQLQQQQQQQLQLHKQQFSPSLPYHPHAPPSIPHAPPHPHVSYSTAQQLHLQYQQQQYLQQMQKHKLSDQVVLPAQIQNETDLAFMRSQISKLIEDHIPRRASLPYAPHSPAPSPSPSPRVPSTPYSPPSPPEPQQVPSRSLPPHVPSPSSPPPAPAEIQWVFPQPKPVLTK